MKVISPSSGRATDDEEIQVQEAEIIEGSSLAILQSGMDIKQGISMIFEDGTIVQARWFNFDELNEKENCVDIVLVLGSDYEVMGDQETNFFRDCCKSQKISLSLLYQPMATRIRWMCRHWTDVDP